MLSIGGYRFPEKIYEGNFSLVFRGKRETDNAPAIVKILKKEYPTSRDLAQFKREYHITRELDVDGVIKAYCLEKYHNSHGMILEDFGGESLARLLRTRRPSLEEFLRLAIQIGQALDRIHRRNVMHKDINPSNIVWNPERFETKIIDFGISAILSRETSAVRNPQFLEGTLAYMSPEQTGRMNRAVDYRTDLYSLGATFFEMLTGEPPFPNRGAVSLVHAHLAQEPRAPSAVHPDIPPVLDQIVLKLLAKAPEDRYQTAFGLTQDLQRCLDQLRETRTIDDFPIGRVDVARRFQIPEKLYGRESELKTLMEAFERTGSGNLEIVLVTGYSGIGKSSLVHEIHKPIVGTDGYFISGKFDQFKRDIPYASLIQAFRELVRQILTESPAQIAGWKDTLAKALDPNGQVIVDVIPEVAHIIGPQPPVPALSPGESENRFNLVFESFVKTFAAKEHPLVLFLDDLQWADTSSLKLIERFATDPELTHMLIIGAYRDNEVDAAHPLSLTLADIRKAGASLSKITLGPLDLDHVNQLIADTLHCALSRSLPLARLCLDKTDGNPFFLNQFLQALHRENSISFDADRNLWCWDLGSIQYREITDNVAALMVRNIQNLPEPTQRVLKLAACIGNRFDLKTLAIVCEQAPPQCAEDLWPALDQGFIIPLNENYKLIKDWADAAVSYRFLHDQVQQAAYSLIDTDRKAEAHQRIGRLLLENTSEEDRAELVFDIANHLNLGSGLLTDATEKRALAQLNLEAGIKAKTSAAFGPAHRYMETGLALLDEADWRQCYDLTLALHVEAAETAYLNADFERTEILADRVIERAATILDRVKVYEVRISAYLSNNNPVEAVKTGLYVLRLMGIQFPAKPGNLSIIRSLLRTKLVLAGKKTETLNALPQMQDPEKLAAIRIMSRIVSAAYITQPLLFALLTFTQVRLSVRYGNAKASAFVFMAYGVMLCGILGDIDNGYRFGKLALNLLGQLDAREFKSKLLYTFPTFLMHWKEDAKKTLKPLLKAYRAGLENGDLEYAGWSVFVFTLYSFLLGRDLHQLDRTLLPYRTALQNFKLEMAVTYTDICHQAALNMMGMAEEPWRLTGTSYDEEKNAAFHSEGKDQLANFCFFFHKSLLCYLFGRLEETREHARRAATHMESASGKMVIPFFFFLDSLSRLAMLEAKPEQARRQLAKVAANQKKLKKWSAHAPVNHRHKYLLVEAERARIKGRDREAQNCYEQALASAREGDFLFEEAMIHEHAARFFLNKAQTQIGHYFLQNARNAYQRWGAYAKVHDLQERYPEIFSAGSERRRMSDRRTTTGREATMTSGEGSDDVLNWATVMKATEALSSEIVLEKLLDKLVNIAMENAGAQRALLVMEEKGSLVIEAVATVDATPSEHGKKEKDPLSFPEGLVQYVARTGKNVVLHDAGREGTFANDPYISRNKPKSVLCTPLLKQGQLKAILYLENNLTTGAFTPQRLEVLQLLSSQAAISLENAKLYTDMERYSEQLEQKVEERTWALRLKNEQLLSSIRYARHIQEAILPDMKALGHVIPQSFVLFKPRDLVSGDFYWFGRGAEVLCFAVVDCTGHGVPGALLSMMGNSLLNQIVNERGLTQPAEVLMHLDMRIRDALRQEQGGESDDGMDLCFCSYRPAERRLLFAGSRRPLYLVRQGNLLEFKGDRKTIGGLRKKKQSHFTQRDLEIQPGDLLYLCSDGFADQAGPAGKKFGSRRLKQFLQAIAGLELDAQKKALAEELKKHQGQEAQLDDITLLGIRL